MFLKEKNCTFNPPILAVKLLERLIKLHKAKKLHWMILVYPRLLIILFSALSGLFCFAQQNTLITHYMFTNMAFNPGYAGSSEGISATGLVRQQWIGFKADDGSKLSPQTFY